MVSTFYRFGCTRDHLTEQFCCTNFGIIVSMYWNYCIHDSELYLKIFMNISLILEISTELQYRKF